MKYYVFDCDSSSFSGFGDLKNGATSVVALNDVTGITDTVARASAIVDAVNAGVVTKTASYPYPVRAVHVPGTSLFQLITVAVDDASELRYESSPGVTGTLPTPKTSSVFSVPALVAPSDVLNAMDTAVAAGIALVSGVKITGMVARPAA